MSKKIKIFFLFLLFPFSHSFAQQKDDYAIFMDLGSSGSRMYVVRYDSSQKLTQSVPIFSEILIQKLKPGVSSFANNIEDSSINIRVMLNNAVDVLNKASAPLEKVKVFLLATGGMRELSLEKEMSIYHFLNTFISTHYPFQIASIKTITGQMEGLYAWLEVNYLLKNFDSPSLQKGNTNQITEGIIDIGGASTQIAFETDKKTLSNDLINIKINKRNYHILSKSYLGLGIRSALQQMNEHPQANYCYPIEYNLKKGQKTEFDANNCHKAYTSIIKNHKSISKHTQTFKNKFTAMGLYQIFNFFDVAHNPEQMLLHLRVNQVCSKNWTELKNAFPSEIYLTDYCANGIYFQKLLYNFYNLTGDQLNIVEEINKKQLGWLRGAIIYNLFN